MTSKLKILLITHFLPPKHNAGTENYTLGLGKALQAEGYDVQLVCAEDWEFGKRYWNGVTTEQFEGIKIHRHHINWQNASDPNRILYDSPIIENWFDKFLTENSFNIAHVTHTYSLGVGVLRSIKRANLPLILTLMDFWFLCPNYQLVRSDGTLCDGSAKGRQCQICLMHNSGLFQKLRKFPLTNSIYSRVFRAIDSIPILSRRRGLCGMLIDMDQRKKVLEEVFVLPDVVLTHSTTVQTIFALNNLKKVKVIRPGHDLSWLGHNFKKINSNVFRFGYLGQIIKIKGVHLLIDAFIKSEFDDRARLEIWGDYLVNKDYLYDLRILMGESPSIFLRGRYERDNLASILSDIDVIIVPSLWYENSPLVIQEALATNTPVIATNIGGMAESISHGKNGLLFEFGNSNDLSKQLRRFIDDPDLLNRLKKQIRPVRTFEDELGELQAIYYQLTSDSNF